MDKEQLKAYTAVRERIASEIDDIIKNGGSPNDLKRLRRYGSSFGWYPEFFPEVMANHGEMNRTQLIGALRGPEEKYMKKMVPIKGMPLHHAVADRTGGDAAFRAPVDTWLETRDRLIQKHQRQFGNSTINLNPSGAVDEKMHQGRWGAKGTVFDPKLGYGGDPVPDLPILHGAGQKNIGESIGKKAAGMTADELFDQLDPIVSKQLVDLETVLENPTTVAQRKVVTDVAPNAFSPDATMDQQLSLQKQLAETGTDVKFAQAFDPNKGRMGKEFLQNLRSKAALGAAAGLTGISILGTGASASETVTRTQIANETGDLADKIQAGISGISLTADLASYSGVGAVPGALVSSGADATNMIIDQIRFGVNRQRIRGRSGAQRALQQP